MQQQEDLFFEANTIINRQKAFRRWRWVTVLSLQEVAVWHHLNGLAIDKDDATVRQTSAEIAAEMGYEGDPSVIRQTKRALAAYGLIVLVEAPRGLSPTMRLVLPGNPERNDLAKAKIDARSARSVAVRTRARASAKRRRSVEGTETVAALELASAGTADPERSAPQPGAWRSVDPERGAATPGAWRSADPERGAPSSIYGGVTAFTAQTAAAQTAGTSAREGEPIAVGMDAAAVEGMEAEAKAILDAVGFPADDGIRRHPNAELPLLRDLALNADFLASIGQLVSRRAYFAKGIEERYGPDSRRVAAEMSAARAAKADAAKRAAAARAEQVRRQSVTSGQDQRDAEARDQATLASLPADRLAELVARAMAEAAPIVTARWRKLGSPIESPTLRAEVLALLRAETAGQVAGQAMESAAAVVGRVA